jgi:AraC family transcriptional regulator, transcriptional activator of pobA
MKKSKNIPITNPQNFVRDYFDHALMKENRYDIQSLIPKEDNCFFSMSAIEDARKYIKFPDGSFKTNHYEILFITDGHYSFTDNLNELTQHRGQIRFVAPGKITAVKTLSSDAKGFYCLFDQTFVDYHTGVTQLLHSFSFFDLDAHPIIQLTEQQTQFFEMVFKKINNDFLTRSSSVNPVICQYLVSILKECNVLYEKILQENKGLISADRIAQDFVRLVNKYYLTKRSLPEYAELLNITPKHLTKSVKQATGETPMNHIFKMLVLETKVLLHDTTMSIAEIAYQLSFEDAAYFNRFFKQHTGLTPSAFRKQH